MINRIVILSILITLNAGAISAASSDTIPPHWFSRKPQFKVGFETTPAFVPGTNTFLRGNNPQDKRISASLSGAFRVGFSFNPATREDILYRNTYQGIGIGATTFFSPALLGTPISAYVYQGAPIFRVNNRLRIGYEWKFGAAFGWKHYDEFEAETNAVASTSVTAHMSLGIKALYSLSSCWDISVGIEATHFSNGNTSIPNAGANSAGLSLGISYNIDPIKGYSPKPSAKLKEEADRPEWMYDITVFGAWRKRIVETSEPVVCPGKFAVVGLGLSPMRRLNRWVAVGPALDVQWDESADLDRCWVDGTFGDNIKFIRPPFHKQLNIGLSAHAELTMPIFTVNAGLGYNILNPRGERRFYQSLTLKTFITKHIYINTGYRLGKFKDPQNLMLGLGLRM